MIRGKAVKYAESAKEYRNKIEAAKTLDFEIEAEAQGTWETQDGEPCWPSGCKIRDAGYKYFEIKMDGEVHKAKPREEGNVKIGLK